MLEATFIGLGPKPELPAGGMLVMSGGAEDPSALVSAPDPIDGLAIVQIRDKRTPHGWCVVQTDRAGLCQLYEAARRALLESGGIP